MEDCATTFFINGLKVHIESSINKYEENLSIIYDQDFDNLFLNPIFINNLSLFRDLIYQNNLNFQNFWNHIGKMMNSSIESIIIKFEEEIKKEKEDDNNLNKEVGNKNILKLKILNICFFFITNEESFELIKEDDKQKLKNLLEMYIKKEIENKSDFSLFIKNYIIKISLLINDNNRSINISFLKFLSFTFYDFGTSYKNNELMNQLKIYIDQAINNPRRELNNLNAAFNKKCFKKERISRSRGASFDIKDNNTNMEKNNKKIYDFFKSNKKEKNGNSGRNKETENKENDNKENLINNIDYNILKKQKSKINNSSTQGKYFHYSSHASNLSLINFNSGISNISNSYGLNNSFSFSKNISNSRLSLDDSFSLTGIFSTPISDLNDNDNDNKKFTSKFPTIIKCVDNKRKKTLDKFFNSQMNIKNYMKVDSKKEEEDELKELKKIINSSFYGNENDYNYKIKNNVNKKNKDKSGNKNMKKKEKEKVDNKNKVNNGKNKDILIYKTPNKNEKTNQENKNENINENIGINGLKKNWELLFAQKPGI